MTIRSRRLVMWVMGVGLAVVTTVFGVRMYLALHPARGLGFRGGERKIVYIKPDSRGREIADLLKQAGVIQDRFLFHLFTYLRGSSDRLKAGEYQFIASMGLLDIIRMLEEGRVLVHRLTIPEGSSLWQIARALDEEGLVDPDRFLELARNPAVASYYVPEADSLEGFLFPDTYHFIKGTKEEAIVETMVQRFFRAFTGDHERQARQRGMSLYEIVTLASIIEKEALLDREKPIIAGVFYNRLERGMRLQADPTVLYGRHHTGRIRYRDLREKHPYNTYVHHGLPPGPIASPGMTALEAALNPAKVNYLYFVSRNDGTHHFSRTLGEHNEAVRKYQVNQGARKASSI